MLGVKGRHMNHRSLNSLLGILLFAITASVPAQETSANLQGWKPYTPTRLEWFAVEMNAENRVQLSEASGYSLDFLPIEKEDSILIYVQYLPTVNRQVMNMSIDTARKLISIKAKSYGWTSWLRIKEDIKILDPK